MTAELKDGRLADALLAAIRDATDDEDHSVDANALYDALAERGFWILARPPVSTQARLALSAAIVRCWDFERRDANVDEIITDLSARGFYVVSRERFDATRGNSQAGVTRFFQALAEEDDEIRAHLDVRLTAAQCAEVARILAGSLFECSPGDGEPKEVVT